MKKPLLIVFFLLSAAVTRSQSFEGTWRGIMIQDSPIVRINFEMVLEQKDGSIKGYIYRLFIVNDSLIYNTVKVAARIADNILIVEDDESVSRNFDDRANRKIKAAYFFKLDPKNKNADTLRGEWTTTRFKNKYMSISGSVSVNREPFYETTQLFKRLEEKQLHKSIAFVPKFTSPDLAVNKNKVQPNATSSTAIQTTGNDSSDIVTDSKKQASVTNTNTQPTVETKPQPSAVAMNQPKQEAISNNAVAKKDSLQSVVINEPKKKEPVANNNTQPKAETKPQPAAVAMSQPKQEAINNNTVAKKDSLQSVVINEPKKKEPVANNNTQPKAETKPQPAAVVVNQPKQQQQTQQNNSTQQKPQPVITNNQKKPVAQPVNNNSVAPVAVVKNEPKPKDTAQQKTSPVTDPVQSIILKTDAVTIKEPTNVIQKPVTTAPVINNAVINTRAIEVIQTLEIAEDSVTLALYDNGEIDGDVVSVFVNNEKIIENVTLKASAFKKTIYFKPGEIIQLTLFAENLGAIPPNTGLLVVYSGEKRYQVFFTSTLNKSSVILLRRE